MRELPLPASPDATFPRSQLGRHSELAQRACCAQQRGAQRFWGPLRDKKVLRARPSRATRVLRGSEVNVAERHKPPGKVIVSGVQERHNMIATGGCNVEDRLLTQRTSRVSRRFG